MYKPANDISPRKGKILSSIHYGTVIGIYTLVLLPLFLSTHDTSIVAQEDITPLPLVSERSDSENLPTPVSPTAFSYTTYQATFLTAKSASVTSSDTGVLIEVQDLSNTISYGVVLSFQGLVDKDIEVTTLLNLNGTTVGVFPPKYLKPSSNNTYPILGKQGDQFGVRVETDEGIRFITAQIDKPTTPVPPTDPPPTDPPTTPNLESITKTVSVAVSTLADTITQSAIKEELQKLLANFPNDISLARTSLKAAISEGLLVSMPKLKPPYKDWDGGFRKPLDKEIIRADPKTAPALKQIVEAIVKGM